MKKDLEGVSMKKHLIVSGIVFVLLMVGFSGCVEQDISGDTNQVELVNEWIDRNTAIDGSKYDYYKGTIRNIAGKHLDNIKIIVKFYDRNDNFLFEKTDYVSNLANSYTKDFSVVVYSYGTYYDAIDYWKYEFKVT